MAPLQALQNDLIDMAQQWAEHYSAAYAGHKPERHAHYAKTLAAARAVLAQGDDEDVFAVYNGKDGRRDWQMTGTWLYPGDRIVCIHAPKDPT